MVPRFLDCYVRLAVVMIAALPGQSIAQHFIFNVPVEVKDVASAYSHLKIQCFVRATGIGSLGVQGAFVSLTGRAYSGVVTVPYTVPAGKNPGDVYQYVCTGHFCASADDSSCINPMFDMARLVQPGTPFTPSVTGSIQ